MKHIVLLVIILSSYACQPKQELPTHKKIAKAHGFEHWDKVKEIKFSFGLGNNKDNRRHWTWQPKTGKVTLNTANQKITYNKMQVDSASLPIDKAFINDKFWLLIPFQLVWDTQTNISNVTKKVAPISKKSLPCITVTYPNQGGYTPGDAYDIYFDENTYLIKEWSFRKANAPKPTLSNTFENYQNFKGIKLALDHKKDNGVWNLNFKNVALTFE